jgi:hypothetical protein
MNHILHNISLIILFTGIIMITVYITKATGFNYTTTEQKLLLMHNLKKDTSVKNIYDYRVSKAYEKMFSQPSIWLGYQDFNPELETKKLYIKTKT